MSSMIQISDSWLNQIKKYLAYPSVDKIILDNDQIKEFCVFPAMIEYFTRFPIKKIDEFGISGELTIPFPDEETFGVLDARVTPQTELYYGTNTNLIGILTSQMMLGGSGINNLNGVRLSTGRKGRSSYNVGGIAQSKYIGRNLAQSIMDKNSTRYDIDLEKREIRIFSLMTARTQVTWAKYSLDFENVKFERKLEVLKLSSSYLLENLSSTVNLLPGNVTNISLDYQKLQDMAYKLREEVYSQWNEFPVIIVHKM